MAESKKAIYAAAAANLGIAVAKFIGAAITGSGSLMAEGLHSVADTGNQGLLLLGGKRAGRSADALHQFGYGPERFFWAFVVALVLFTLGALFSIYEGIEKILHPHDLDDPQIAVVILLLSAMLEGLSFRTAMREASHIRGDEGMWRFLRRTKSAELAVVILEDTGALVGLLIALICVTASWLTGNPLFDAIGTVLIGVLLGVIAAFLAAETKSMLIGEAVTDEHRDALIQAIEAAPEVRRVIHMRTLHLSPDDVLVAAKIDMDPGLNFAQVADVIDACEANARRALPAARLIYLEPDAYESAPNPSGPGDADSGADS